jgi:hypothetical protein
MAAEHIEVQESDTMIQWLAWPLSEVRLSVQLIDCLNGRGQTRNDGPELEDGNGEPRYSADFSEIFHA